MEWPPRVWSTSWRRWRSAATPSPSIGDEPRLAYNRVLLSSVLAGETASHDIELRPARWWRDRGVTLKYGCVATEIDVGRRELKIANEESIAFSKLVLATGSSPLRLNVPGADLPGVHTFRDSRDVDLLLALAAQKKRVVVVGGGLLGLEAAYGLAAAGAPVTLLHLMDRLMERQLDAPAAELLKSPGRAQGHRGSAQRQHRAHPWRDPRRGSRTRGRPADRRRCGDFRGRHPAQCRAGEGGRHSGQSRHRRRRLLANRRARISSRSANAPSIAASATAWSSRPTSRRACWRGISPGATAAYARAAWSRPI